MSRISLTLDILPGAQRALWPRLRPVAAHGFTLYGGTAVALRLGHRQSADFDFFTDRALDPDRLAGDLPFLGEARPIQATPDSWTVLVQEAGGDPPVKLAFFGGSTMERVGDPDWSEDCLVRVASELDLMATKLKVLLRRTESGDYADIAAMTRSDIDLADGLAAARALHPKTFPPSKCLRALTWFEGGGLESLSDEDRSDLRVAAASVGELPDLDRKTMSLGSDVPCPREAGGSG